MNNLKRRDFLRSAGILGGTLLVLPGLKAMADDLPQVLIVGDSISMGYGPVVKRLLEGKAVVTRPNENCESTQKGVAKLDEWLGNTKYKVIYFNFGLHDLKHVDAVTKEPSAKATDPLLTPLPIYAANLAIIAKKLKATGAKVIFATTTPVPDHPGSPLREPEAPAKYNKVAIAVMANEGIEVDDLYNLALPQIKQIQIPDNVHYIPEGYEAFGKHIVSVISKYLS